MIWRAIWPRLYNYKWMIRYRFTCHLRLWNYVMSNIRGDDMDNEKLLYLNLSFQVQRRKTKFLYWSVHVQSLLRNLIFLLIISRFPNYTLKRINISKIEILVYWKPTATNPSRTVLVMVNLRLSLKFHVFFLMKGIDKCKLRSAYMNIV